MTSLIGRRLGQYEIVDTLGEGGMASVYLGRQESIDRLVAVKVLPPHPALNDAFKERFQLEAKTIGSLQHPSILPLFDYGTQDDVLYLVMAYAKDGSLDDRLDNGAMDVQTVERYLRTIAQGLDHAHSKGVIHRDIKPANILMNGDHPMLADFGMVKLTQDQVNLTGTAIVGTPAYMSPEQGQGEVIDHRADIYSLGVMVYEMLTGRRPFVGETQMQVIIKHIQDAPEPINKIRPQLSQALSDVIMKSLAKEPDDRFATAGDFAEAFSNALHQDDSNVLNQVREEIPLDPPENVRKQPPTVQLGDLMPKEKRKIQETIAASGKDKGSPSQTIILREGNNPLILIGGFALIAVAIIAGALLLGNQGDDSEEVLAIETEAVVAETQAPVATEVTVVIPEVPSFGDVRYSTQETLGDTITISLDGVRPASDGQYAAWLINTDGDETLFIGEISVDSFGEGVVSYTDESDALMLAAQYNAVGITLEEDGIGETPMGEILYSAFVPPAVNGGLREIFVASDDGISGASLLDGALLEARLAEQHAGLASRATSISSVRVHAEHTINILNGTQDDFDGSGSGQNPGRGVGVYFFIDAIEAILEEGTQDASAEVQRNAENIRVCTVNVRIWADQVEQLELAMIAGESVEDVAEEAAESTVLMEQITTGFDANENGNVEPFEGECGLNQIPDFGLAYARMSIVEGNIIDME